MNSKELKTISAVDFVSYKGKDNEIIGVEYGDKIKPMCYYDGTWHSVAPENAELKLSLYDLNKQGMHQLPTITDFTSKRTDIMNTLLSWNNEYCMIYGKEISYFTLLHLNHNNPVKECPVDVILECLHNVGEVKAFDLTDDETGFEIWVDTGDEATCLYLFPYDTGVVDIGV